MEVVIYSKTEGEPAVAIVCTQVEHTDEKWVVETLKPQVKRFELNREEWPRCERIVGRIARR